MVSEQTVEAKGCTRLSQFPMDLSVCFWILWGSNYTNNKPVEILKSHLAVAMSHEGEDESL